MNDLLALAAAVRERYLEALLASLADFADLHQPSAAEVMFELQRDEPLPFRLYRADTAAGVDGTTQVQEVNPSTHLGFEPFGIEFVEGVTAAVSPFVWNDVAVLANITLPAEPVEAWALHWLDLDEQFTEDEHGLKGVVHSIVREDAADGSTLLCIDFGSAPVAALQELVTLAFSAGASHLSIHSQSLQ